MKLVKSLAILALATVVCGPAAWCAESANNKGAGKPQADELFTKLKTLCGEWQPAEPSDDFPKDMIVVRYATVAGGSALTEVDFPGSEREMLSVYHRDGGKLMMTHYCCMGNQPRMQVQNGKSANEIVLAFDGGTNLDPAKDAHIHGGVIRILDENHIQSEWEFYSKGTLKTKHTFNLVRKK